MKKIIVASVIILILGVIVAFLAQLFGEYGVAVLEPRGIIAQQQKTLLVFAFVLSLFVILPVFVLTILIVLKYREGNKKAEYSPNWDHNKKLEAIWWGLPIFVIVILSVVTFISSHELDPYKEIASNKKPLKVQVVALQWKWLFIYPEQNIATVDRLTVPENTPINFELTSDAPMNSFWVPQLGGQVYAMAGMTSKLHLMADGVGDYRGSSGNISGEGHADMDFRVSSVTEDSFDKWVNSVERSSTSLGNEEYLELSKPSRDNQELYFRLTNDKLFNSVVMSYMQVPDYLPKAHSDTMMMEGH